MDNLYVCMPLRSLSPWLYRVWQFEHRAIALSKVLALSFPHGSLYAISMVDCLRARIAE